MLPEHHLRPFTWIVHWRPSLFAQRLMLIVALTLVAFLFAAWLLNTATHNSPTANSSPSHVAQSPTGQAHALPTGSITHDLPMGAVRRKSVVPPLPQRFAELRPQKAEHIARGTGDRTRSEPPPPQKSVRGTRR